MEERLPGRSTKVKGREEGEEDEDTGLKRIRNEIAHEVVTGIRDRTGPHEEAETSAQRTVVQSLMRSWDRSQIENDEEEEEQLWQKKCSGREMNG